MIDIDIDIDIDGLTNCLIERATGREVETSISRATLSDVKGLKGAGWKFDWAKPIKVGQEVYKLTLQDDIEIQGMLALKNDKELSATYLSLIENNSNNIGTLGKYKGVGAHLAAIGCKRSFDYGYGGYAYFDAKTQLVAHYKKELGAMQIGQSQRMRITEAAAKILIDKYKLGDWRAK